MSRLELTGLRADVPLGAMAAFGCLRLCERIADLRGSKLAFAGTGGVDTAVLFTPRDTGREALVAALVQDVKQASGRMELTWRDQIKTASRDEFRAAAKSALEAATMRNREAADWFASFGSELELSRKGTIRATPLDMTGGQQKFLGDALKLANDLAQPAKHGRPSPSQRFTEALFGPWRYAEDQHSWGWDPSRVRFGAFTSEAPSEMKKEGVGAAVWLAFESLPLFSCFYASGLRTTGLLRQERLLNFWWPVWRVPSGLATIRSLLALDFANTNERDLRARGIHALYRSTRANLLKDYGAFRFPELVFGEIGQMVGT